MSFIHVQVRDQLSAKFQHKSTYVFHKSILEGLVFVEGISKTPDSIFMANKSNWGTKFLQRCIFISMKVKRVP